MFPFFNLSSYIVLLLWFFFNKYYVANHKTTFIQHLLCLQYFYSTSSEFQIPKYQYITLPRLLSLPLKSSNAAPLSCMLLHSLPLPYKVASSISSIGIIPRPMVSSKVCLDIAAMLKQLSHVDNHILQLALKICLCSVATADITQ